MRLLSLGGCLLFAVAARLVRLPLPLFVVCGGLLIRSTPILRNRLEGLAGFRVGLSPRAVHQLLLGAGPFMAKAHHLAPGRRAFSGLLGGIRPLELSHLRVRFCSFGRGELLVLLSLGSQ